MSPLALLPLLIMLLKRLYILNIESSAVIYQSGAGIWAGCGLVFWEVGGYISDAS